MPNKSAPCSEDEMQQNIAEYFSKRRFVPTNWDGWYESMIIPKIYREVNISQISRISDVIVYITDRKIVNIECKMTDYDGVIRQAKDHLKWADYSYVCLFADTYLPSYGISNLIKSGIGLLLWQPEMFVEVIQAGYNKNKDKNIRLKVMDILKNKDRSIRIIEESKLQQKLF